MIAKIVAWIAVFAPEEAYPVVPSGVVADRFLKSIRHMMIKFGPQGAPSVCESILEGSLNYSHLDSVRLQDPWDFCEFTRRPGDGVWKIKCTMPSDSSTWQCLEVSPFRVFN